ncbi:MAG TPA: hypothetical protein VHW69_06645, partial [Rhizomicrobium sp.]|nr:hypothetical protein [Rhizomicrobium sp.]
EQLSNLIRNLPLYPAELRGLIVFCAEARRLASMTCAHVAWYNKRGSRLASSLRFPYALSTHHLIAIG